MSAVAFRFWEEAGSWWYGKAGAGWKYGPFSSRDSALVAAECLCQHMGWTLSTIYI